jgi:hypothetical protein
MNGGRGRESKTEGPCSMVDDAKAHHLVGTQHRVRKFLLERQRVTICDLQMTKRGKLRWS